MNFREGKHFPLPKKRISIHDPFYGHLFLFAIPIAWALRQKKKGASGTQKTIGKPKDRLYLTFSKLNHFLPTPHTAPLSLESTVLTQGVPVLTDPQTAPATSFAGPSAN